MQKFVYLTVFYKAGIAEHGHATAKGKLDYSSLTKWLSQECNTAMKKQVFLVNIKGSITGEGKEIFKLLYMSVNT